MAEARKSVELDGLERAWIRVSIEAKRSMIVRSRAKEMSGSEVDILRGNELKALDALLAKFN